MKYYLDNMTHWALVVLQIKVWILIHRRVDNMYIGKCRAEEDWGQVVASKSNLR